MDSEQNWRKGRTLKESASVRSSSIPGGPSEQEGSMYTEDPKRSTEGRHDSNQNLGESINAAEPTKSASEMNISGGSDTRQSREDPDGMAAEDLWKTEESMQSWTTPVHDWGRGRSLRDSSTVLDSISSSASELCRSASVGSSTDTVQEWDSRQMTRKSKESEEDRLIFLDDRGTLLYYRDEAHKPFEDHLPDDYFEVTLDDVKLLMRDRERQRQELEDIPLKTQAIREAEYLMRLNKYPKAVLRVHFPDGFVLQSSFKATDTVKKVEDLVRSYLEDESLDFSLYITPPKRLLCSEERLFEVPLVPTAVVHFACEVHKEHYLKQTVQDKVSSLVAANRSAASIRSVENRSASSGPRASSENVAQADTRTVGLTTPNSGRVNRSTGAVPKWFQAGMKK